MECFDYGPGSAHGDLELLGGSRHSHVEQSALQGLVGAGTAPDVVDAHYVDTSELEALRRGVGRVGPRAR